MFYYKFIHLAMPSYGYVVISGFVYKVHQFNIALSILHESTLSWQFFVTFGLLIIFLVMALLLMVLNQ